MDASRTRLPLIAGLALMIVGALDPMEGSVIILAGSAVAAYAAYTGRPARTSGIIAAFVMILVGVGSMWGFSAIGGVGGNSGRSIWWLLTMAPYPVGWVTGLVSTISSLRARRPATA